MFRMTRPVLALSLSFFLFVTAAHGQNGTMDAPDLVSHRAVYDISLKSASERSGIKNISGRMVYEFTGTGCSNYTMNFRYVTRVETGDGAKLTDQQTKTVEDLANKRFEFETKSLTDNELDKTVKGSAIEKPEGLSVELISPETKELKVDEARFPTEHMIDVISKAKSGEKFFESQIFDGSEDADKNLFTTTIIGKQVAPEPNTVDSDADKTGQFATLPYWPIVISYFDGVSGKDETPTYRMSFKLYENGVTRDLTMDYGDFILTGKLSSMEVLPAEECKK